LTYLSRGVIYLSTQSSFEPNGNTIWPSGHQISKPSTCRRFFHISTINQGTHVPVSASVCYTVSMKSIYLVGGFAVVALGLGYLLFSRTSPQTIPPTQQTQEAVQTTPDAPANTMVTLSGTYVCLPFLPTVTKTADCAFGIRTDTGEYYAVNFGASAGSMADFRDGAHITARGMIILRADLRPDSWTSFDIQGLFTIMEKPSTP
jgi:hypothetical protein